MSVYDIDLDASGRGTVTLDGVPVQGVHGIRIIAESDCPPRIILDIKAGRIKGKLHDAEAE